MALIGGTREQREAQILAQLYASWDAGILTPGTEEPGTGVRKSHEEPEVTKAAAAPEYVPSHDGSRFISKIRLADAVKVGKEGYIHGFICVRPPCGKYSEATFNSKSGAIEHGGERIGRLRLNADKSFSVNHVAGDSKTKLNGQFADRKDAASSVALYHNIDAMHSAADPGAAKDHLAAARTALAAGDHNKAISELSAAHSAAASSDAGLAEHINSTRASLASHPRPANAPAGVAHEPEAVKPAEEIAKPAEVHAPAPLPTASKPVISDEPGMSPVYAQQLRMQQIRGMTTAQRDKYTKLREDGKSHQEAYAAVVKPPKAPNWDRPDFISNKPSAAAVKPAAASEPAKLTPSTIAIDPKHDYDMQQHGVSAASRISMSSDPKAIAAGMTDDELRAADNELARRAKQMGMEGKVGRSHQAVKDEITSRAGTAKPAGEHRVRGDVMNAGDLKPGDRLLMSGTDRLSYLPADKPHIVSHKEDAGNGLTRVHFTDPSLPPRAFAPSSQVRAERAAKSAESTPSADANGLPYHQKQAYDMRVANGMSHEKAMAYAQFVPEPKASSAAPPPKMSAIEMGIQGGKVSTGSHGTSGPPMKSKVGSYQEARQAEIRNAAPLSHKVGDPEGQKVSSLTGEVRYGSSPGIVGHLKKVPGGYQAVSAKTGEVTGVHAKRPSALEELAGFHNAATEAERAAKAGPEQVAGSAVTKPAVPAASTAPVTGKKVNVKDLPAGVTVHDSGRTDYAGNPVREVHLNGKHIADVTEQTHEKWKEMPSGIRYGEPTRTKKQHFQLVDPTARAAAKNLPFAQRQALLTGGLTGERTIGDAAAKALANHRQLLAGAPGSAVSGTPKA